MSTQTKITIVVVLVVGLTAFAIYEKQSGTDSDGTTTAQNKSATSGNGNAELPETSLTDEDNTDSDQDRQNDADPLFDQPTAEESDDGSTSDATAKSDSEESEASVNDDSSSATSSDDGSNGETTTYRLSINTNEGTPVPEVETDTGPSKGDSTSSLPDGADSGATDGTGAGTSTPANDSETTSTTGEWPKSHEVKPGENLWKISSQYYGAGQYWKSILRANSDTLSSAEDLKKEMTLTIPAPPNQDQASTSSSSSPEDPPSEAGPGQSWYKLKKGENLWEVAKNELGDGTKYKDILDANRDRIEDPDNIKSGTWLLLPEGSE